MIRYVLVNKNTEKRIPLKATNDIEATLEALNGLGYCVEIENDNE